MHYKKYVDRGIDPRCRSYYLYNCSICGHEEIFWWVPNFDTVRLRKCPKCGVENDTSEVDYLVGKKSALEKEAQKKSIELAEINLQIADVSARLIQAQVAVRHESQHQPVKVLS
jgi:hypothetical protein